MSKKKAFTGSTMTLKDFHGGSIPSDLPLPSAPGVVVRISDRSGLDRQIQGSWGNPINRADHRSRPGSSGTNRNFDENASFLSHPAHIGRNFDEDERKPFDSAPRRSIANDEPLNPSYEDRRTVSVRVPSNRLDPKPEPASVLFSSRPQSNPSSHALNAPAQPSLGISNFSDQPKSSGISAGSSQISAKWSSGANSNFQGSSNGQVGASSVPNAWAAKKEPGLGFQEQNCNEQMPSSAWSGPNAVSKFAQASALEKVSSGRWQSKLASTAQQSQQLIYQSGVEVLKLSESENNVHSREKMYVEGGRLGSFRQTKAEFSAGGERDNQLINTEAYDLGPDRGDLDADNRRIEGSMWARYGEKARVVEDGVRVSEEFLDYERVRSPLYSDAKERNRGFHNLEYSLSGASHSSQLNSGFYSDGGRPASTDGKLGGRITGSGSSQLQLHPEVSERPKLKLLPRTRPLEQPELHILDHKQSYQQPADSGHVEITDEAFGNTNHPKPGSAGAEGGNKAADRPKLNLKPRSQTFEQADENVGKERKNPFGGARPRELVLKERGVDDVVINNPDLSQPIAHRGKHEPSKSEPPALMTRPDEKPETYLVDQRDIERKDHRIDGEKADPHRSSWRNEHRRNGRETEKQQEHDPESWRKPVELQKLVPPSLTSEIPAARHRRAASALELAQAFSRPVSDAGAADRFSNQRGFPGCPGGSGTLPGRNPVPFSRLTETREFYSSSAQRQINGY